MAPTFADVTKAKYVSLTLFTKDGRPKPTAIWVGPDGDAALVITEKNAWKVFDGGAARRRRRESSASAAGSGVD
jgi:PPOX class probable F420-dependent enzyme